MKVNSIYVAASRQHVGKTTSTLGLVTAFMNKGYNVGYCKPVGQKAVDFNNIRVDKDAFLFSDVMGFDLKAEVHSPVILGRGATSAYIENPQNYDYPDRVAYASSIIEPNHEVVIYEGTGHPGVGSVVGLSNADVAKMLNAGVVMVVEGGIGSTIDMLSMCTASFHQRNVPLLGVIINKVRVDKIDKVRYYVSKKLKAMGIPLLGILPYDKTLAFPLLRTVGEAIKGVVIHNSHKLDNKVEELISGSLLDAEILAKSSDLLLVVSSRLIDNALNKIERIAQVLGLQGSPISGIIATGQGELEVNSLDYIKKHEIPLIRTSLDTFGVVLKSTKIEVKINTSTPWKVKTAVKLFDENVNLDLLLDQVNIPAK